MGFLTINLSRHEWYLLEVFSLVQFNMWKCQSPKSSSAWECCFVYFHNYHSEVVNMLLLFFVHDLAIIPHYFYFQLMWWEAWGPSIFWRLMLVHKMKWILQTMEIHCRDGGYCGNAGIHLPVLLKFPVCLIYSQDLLMCLVYANLRFVARLVKCSIHLKLYVDLDQKQLSSFLILTFVHITFNLHLSPYRKWRIVTIVSTLDLPLINTKHFSLEVLMKLRQVYCFFKIWDTFNSPNLSIVYYFS